MFSYSWVSQFVVDFLSKQALTDVTAWVKQYSELEAAKNTKSAAHVEAVEEVTFAPSHPGVWETRRRLLPRGNRNENKYMASNESAVKPIGLTLCSRRVDLDVINV
jgi:hypothetical protein